MDENTFGGAFDMSLNRLDSHGNSQAEESSLFLVQLGGNPLII